MMSNIISAMLVFSILAALLGGKLSALSAASMNGCKQAIELTITLSGSIALWGGVMRIAEKSGITHALCRALSPLVHGVLFPRLRRESPAAQAISMNLAANLLGLGNAATPLGLTAMRELEKETGGSTDASTEMITFVVLNTASLQILPTTTAFLRLQAGSAHPMEILLPVWLCSLAAVTVAVVLSKALGRAQR
ncbi:MAG: spore maturation protein A [Angelakisella sp.]